MRLLTVQHVPGEGLGLLAEKLMNNGWELDIRPMYLPRTLLPDNLDDHQAMIILGGPMGAYEENSYPYLHQVQELIRDAVAKGIPTVGICLGGQLIARALGAAVGPNPQKEIGWYPIHLLSEGKASRLFQALPPALPVFQWHGDTFALPVGAVLLAAGEICPNQAFVYNNHIWALQFHLEVSQEMIQNWSDDYRDELTDFGGPGAAENLQRNTQARWEHMRGWQDLFLDNLLAILESKNT